MSTCCWCTPGGPAAIQILRSYASATSEFSSANDDLCYCLECVDEYHKARDEAPSLHETLWKLETSRLIVHFETSLKENGEDDDLYIVEGEKKIPLSCYTGPGFEKHLRVPMLEILKYPYLLLEEHLSNLFVEALCKMEQINYSYQVVGKHPGIYLLMVHPNEEIRRWAILTARNLGKVDRDDYYDIQEVLTCLFKVIEPGLFENPDIYNASMCEKGKLNLLPSHLYDTTNYKNYWLGICMLLTVLEEQAMDSLLLGPDKQNDFMQSIMNIMNKQTDDDRSNPFWPALHCFMVILDKLGSKVWGQRIDPIQAFQTIINNDSYKKEIENIRQNFRRTKSEPLSDYGDEMITCSQIVYNCHLERPNKEPGWKSSICPDYCPNMYEEMQSLTEMFQYDIGRDMQLHNSTFLWYLPFVHSLMDLKDMGVAYSVVVIHHLCSEIKDVFNNVLLSCDKVSEFYIWILTTVVELNLKKNCLNSLWVSSEKWVEAVVKCAVLPSTIFLRGVERGLTRNSSRNPTTSWEPESVQWACMNLIRNILKEGYQMGQSRTQFLDQLNLLRRTREDWRLSPQQAQELQECLKHIIRNIRNKSSNPFTQMENTVACVPPPPFATKQERQDGRALVNSHVMSPPHLSPREQDDGQPDASLPRRHHSLDKEFSHKDPHLYGTSTCYLTNIKQEPEESLKQDRVTSLLANGHTEAQKSGSSHQGLGDSKHTNSVGQGFQGLEAKDVSEKEKMSTDPKCPTDNNHRDNVTSETERAVNKLRENIKSKKSDITLKLKQLVGTQKRKSSSLQSGNDGSNGVEEQVGNKLGMNSSVTLHGKPLFIKLESKDRLVEFKSALKVDQNLEDDSSDDDEMAHVPFSQIRQDLVKKKSTSATASSETDSQIDRELGKLSRVAYSKATDFPVDSSQEDTTLCQNHIKRKVQGAVRSLLGREAKSKPLSGTDKPQNPIIIISDTSSEEEDEKVNVDTKSNKEEMSACPEKQLSAQKQEQAVSASNSPLLFAECESQCFEFETEEDIYSAWQDSQMDEKTEERDLPGMESHSPPSSNIALVQQINDWGYETDYLGEDVTEKAAEDLEQQVNESKSEPELHVATSKVCVSSSNFTEKQTDGGEHSRHTVPVVSSTFGPSGSSELMSDLKKHKSRPGRNSTDSPQAKTANKSPGERNIKPAVHSGKHPPVKPSRSTPAITPPRKVHKFPEPTLVTEKLFLKKRIRRAAELSQRTQDCITKLREYGKTAGELPQKRRAKLIQAQHLSGRNKKMLSCKERHFLSQRRHKEREKDDSGNLATKITKKADPNPCLQTARRGLTQNQEGKTYPSSHSSSSKRKLIKQSLVGRERDQPSSEPSGEKRPLTRQGSVDSVPKNTTVVPGSLDSLSTGGSRTGSGVSLGCSANLCHEITVLKEGPSKLNENPISDDESLFLTQLDPVDMELCSQVEGGPDPAGVEGNLPQPPFEKSPLGMEKCKHGGCDEKVSGAGSYCRSHSASDPKNHVFAKPFPPAKASTAKIFSSSSSRSANLTKELENVPRPLAALKSKSNPTRPLVSDCLRQRNLTLKTDPQHQNMNSVSQSASIHSVCNGRAPPAARAAFRPEPQPFFPQSNSMNVQHRDHSIFIKEILKWSYDMFANASQLGPPDHLQRKIVGPVPVRFQDYNDYFNTFFPLTMLNAFEEVAQEWLENQKQKEKRLFRLQLLNYNAGLNKADFTANVSESDLERQLHPKEDDLVFLKVSEKHSYYEEDEAEDSLIRYVGLVTRFSPPSVHCSKKKEQPVLCHLSIQTQGNLSRVNKQVRCVVVSSLVTTQRKFRALLLLNRSLLARPIISPSYGDFCPRDLNVDSEKSDLNKDQRRAVETAYAMVSQHPELPKICLIHGPPGTGKSKTIVGLLYRMLSERSEKENTVQHLNAKIKRNRVLVCAPSNAAVDDLMKKIILEFKEKCQNKKNALGNCGDINLVRLGQQRSINKEVRRFSLDDQVNYRINRAALGKDQDLQKRKEALDQKLDMLSRQRAMDRSEKREKRQQLDEEIGRLVKERQCLGSELKQARGRSQELKASIILESHIICCTLSTSGGVLLESAFRRLGGDPVSCVIVDEAGQTCEVETLIPLIHGCKKLVLVGDPKQLPPTVKSMKAQDYGYDQSLMGRLCRHFKVQVQENQLGRLPVLQLTIQYRMHPDIWLFPAKYIYEATVVTDEKTQENRCSLEWPFQPYMLFDVLDGREEKDSDSYANPQEVKLVIELIKLIKGTRSDIGFRQIGIITPYNAQKRRIRNQLDKDFGENSACEVDTVDGFQGREKDCIIVTCVRANSTQGSIGFLRSLQRLNVTITRAKYSLFIVGKLKTLMESPDWYQLIQDAQKRGNIFKTSSSNYKAVAQKILKLKREIIRHGPVGPAWSKPGNVPRRDSQHPAVKTDALAQGSSGLWTLPGPPELLPSSSTSAPNPPLPTQPKPVQERPKDPRLARRVDLAMATNTSKEGSLSASRGSGMVSPLGPEAPQAFQQPPSSGPVPSFHLPGLVGPTKFFRAQHHDLRAPITADEAKSLGRGDHQSEERDSRRRIMEEFQESPGPVDAKRRRTTH